MSDLIAVVIHLEAGAPPGAVVRRWFFAQVTQHAPALLPQDAHQQRPFTIAVLHDDAQPYIRITGLHAAASRFLRETVLPALAESPFAVTGWTTEAHPDAGEADYTALVAGARQESQTHRQRFVVVSPLTFRQDGRDHPLPLPTLFYGSLLNRWRVFTGEDFLLPVEPFIAAQILLGDYRLHTVRHPAPRPTLGCVGRLSFVLRKRAPLADWHHQARMIAVLSRFAFYAGVGASTTYGMGQVYRGAPVHPQSRRATVIHERGRARGRLV